MPVSTFGLADIHRDIGFGAACHQSLRQGSVSEERVDIHQRRNPGRSNCHLRRWAKGRIAKTATPLPGGFWQGPVDD
jgi:hypothetical protein